MVMFISGIRPDAALRTADEIQKKLSEKSIEHKYSDISDKLTVSMGIYNTEYAGQDIYSLLIRQILRCIAQKKKDETDMKYIQRNTDCSKRMIYYRKP